MPMSKYYWKDPEKYRARRRAAYRHNRDRELAKAKVYRETHREELRDKARKRYRQLQLSEVLRKQHQRAVDACVDSELSSAQWTHVLAFYGGRCAYTKESPNGQPLSLDHFIPLSRGGRHALGNVVPAAGLVNSIKQARDPIEFLDELGVDVDQFLERLEQCTIAWQEQEQPAPSEEPYEPDWVSETEVPSN